MAVRSETRESTSKAGARETWLSWREPGDAHADAGGGGVEAPWTRWRGSHLAVPRDMLIGTTALQSKPIQAALKTPEAAEANTVVLWRGPYPDAGAVVAEMRAEFLVNLDDVLEHSSTPEEAYELVRRSNSLAAEKARRVVLRVASDGTLMDVTKAPFSNVAEALREWWSMEGEGPVTGESLMPLSFVRGLLGGLEWYRRGFEVPRVWPQTQTRADVVHPRLGVFGPMLRTEYLGLIAAELRRVTANVPLRNGRSALVGMDVGTGTGVLALMMLRAGFGHVTATDNSVRAVRNAKETLALVDKAAARWSVSHCDLFPAVPPSLGPGRPGTVDVAVCNPPWIPLPSTDPQAVESASSPELMRSVYDVDSNMLRGFLKRVRPWLKPQTGEAWVVLSDFAELVGLRRHDDVGRWANEAGLRLVGQTTVRPTNKKARDESDPLSNVRMKEVTRLLRFGVKSSSSA